MVVVPVLQENLTASDGDRYSRCRRARPATKAARLHETTGTEEPDIFSESIPSAEIRDRFTVDEPCCFVEAHVYRSHGRVYNCGGGRGSDADHMVKVRREEESQFAATGMPNENNGGSE